MVSMICQIENEDNSSREPDSLHLRTGLFSVAVVVCIEGCIERTGSPPQVLDRGQRIVHGLLDALKLNLTFVQPGSHARAGHVLSLTGGLSANLNHNNPHCSI